MNEPIGHRRWALAFGYSPGWSNGPEPQFTSHETACLLNASDKDEHVEITAFFSDREPTGPYRLTVLARRSLNARFNELRNPEPIPVDTDYASVIVSDVPIVVQHTRLDSRQAENALLSTIAYASNEYRRILVAQNTAQFMLGRLADWGVRRIYGYPGDGINGLLGAFHEVGDRIEFTQTAHEEIAAFAATAHAKVTGEGQNFAQVPRSRILRSSAKRSSPKFSLEMRSDVA
jgi:hypothetical protein